MADFSTNPQPSSTHQQQYYSIPPMYYQSLATVNVANFVTIKLSGDKKSNSYSSWKLQVLSLIKSHDLLGFIDGSIQPLQTEPSASAQGGEDDVGRDGSPEAYNIWRTDTVLRGWILGSISEPRVLSSVATLASAQAVWVALEKRFEHKGTVPVQRQPTLDEEDFFNVQIPLLKAAQNGNWEAARPLLEVNPGAAKTWIDDDNIVTPLEVAVGTGKALDFVQNLLALIPDDESVALKNDLGSTALHISAAVGNEAAARLLIQKMPRLCYISDNNDEFPIHYAALYAQRNMLEYLISVTREEMNPNPYASEPGARLLMYAIDADFFDIVALLVEKYPYLALVKHPYGVSALDHLIRKIVLLNKKNFNFWERLVLSCIPAKTTSISDNGESDIESRTNRPQAFQNLNVVLRKILQKLVPQIRTIDEKLRANERALELVKLICYKLRSWSNVPEARHIYENSILTAAELGARDVVRVIMDMFPLPIYAYQLPFKKYIFHKAVENREVEVFNLIYQMSYRKHLFTNMVDENSNNLLHLAGKLAPAHKLNEISGAPLQMQREMQWFKEAEKFVHPSTREQKNNAGQTPRMMFTEEHKKLKEEGEKWMKDTANSCTISAALIVTVMFAAAITIPGGNVSDTGFPMFSKQPAFIVFAVSDGISLFTSATSLLLFLAILTSRYNEEDFVRVLPKRLIFGLATLFLSITFMIISFSATLYLVFGKNQERWVLGPVLISACFPITSFVLLQFPLLVDLISSTYGPGIFGKKSNRPFF